MSLTLPMLDIGQRRDVRNRLAAVEHIRLAFGQAIAVLLNMSLTPEARATIGDRRPPGGPAGTGQQPGE